MPLGNADNRMGEAYSPSTAFTTKSAAPDHRGPPSSSATSRPRRLPFDRSEAPTSLSRNQG